MQMTRVRKSPGDMVLFDLTKNSRYQYYKKFMTRNRKIWSLDPMTAKSDQHPILPRIVTFESNIEVMRIKKMIIKWKLLIQNQILFVRAIGNGQRTVWRMHMLMLGCKGALIC